MSLARHSAPFILGAPRRCRLVVPLGHHPHPQGLAPRIPRSVLFVTSLDILRMSALKRELVPLQVTLLVQVRDIPELLMIRVNPTPLADPLVAAREDLPARILLKAVISERIFAILKDEVDLAVHSLLVILVTNQVLVVTGSLWIEPHCLRDNVVVGA